MTYVLVARQHMNVWGDPFYFSGGADALAQGKGFVNPFGLLAGRTVPAADHPPLYLLYLAGFAVVGVTTVLGQLLASAVLGTGSIVLAGLAGRQMSSPRVGLLAAGLVAVYPNTWRYDGTLYSETMVIFVVLLSIWAAYRYLARPSSGRLVAVGVTVGLAALARSELVLLFVLLLVPLGLRGRHRPLRQRLGWTAAAGTVGLLVLLPWVAFNLSRFDHTVLLSRNLGGTLATANCDSVYSGPQIGQWDYRCGVAALAASHVDAFDDGSDAVMQRSGQDYIRHHLRRVPVVVAARLGRVTGLFRPGQQVTFDVQAEQGTRWVAQWGSITYYLVAVLAIAGAVRLRRRSQALVPLLAPIASVLITVALFFGSTRFRASAEGALCLLAAVAVDAAWVLIARRRRSRQPAV